MGYIPGEKIGGWAIDEDGYWKPLPCRGCNGTKVVARPANAEERAQGYDSWHRPCAECYGYGMQVFRDWVRSGAP